VTAYLRTRLLATIPVVFGVSLLVFACLYLLPGDPIQALAGDVPLDPVRVAELRQQLGLNDPAWLQYLHFVGNALHGDLGKSLQSHRPVLDEILIQLPATIQLTLAATAIALALGITLGVLAALRPYSWLDTTSMLVALGGVSVPAFWLGLMLLLVFAVWLRWVPATGTEGPVRLILPALTLGYGAAAIIARLTRGAMLEVLGNEYIATARAKGLSTTRVVLRPALRNALIPVLTIVGLQVGNLLSGAVVVETVFSRQGIGRMLVNGIMGKDIPLVQGTVLFVATFYVLLNLAVDVLYAWVDPRIRHS
jgi:peptide/nickel transport system permease protein